MYKTKIVNRKDFLEEHCYHDNYHFDISLDYSAPIKDDQKLISCNTSIFINKIKKHSVPHDSFNASVETKIANNDLFLDGKTVNKFKLLTNKEYKNTVNKIKHNHKKIGELLRDDEFLDELFNEEMTKMVKYPEKALVVDHDHKLGGTLYAICLNGSLRFSDFEDNTFQSLIELREYKIIDIELREKSRYFENNIDENEVDFNVTLDLKIIGNTNNAYERVQCVIKEDKESGLYFLSSGYSDLRFYESKLEAETYLEKIKEQFISKLSSN